MAKGARKFSEDVEEAIISQVIGSEFVTAQTNMQNDTDDFESYIDLLDSIRSEKEYDWNSDIAIPEFASQMLTQSSIDVGQYFQTRDFAEVYLQEDSEEASQTADAAKELINRTLNQRHIHHYQKFVRGKLCNHLLGRVYLRCWWEQKVERVETSGATDPSTGIQAEPTTSEKIVFDRFNYDVLDPRNVFTDNEYVYSLQDKKWIIIRFERTLEQLKADKESMGYFNLDRLDKKPDGKETETSRDTYNKIDAEVKESKPVSKSFDILERYGSYWTVKSDDGVRPGIDKEGNVIEGAVFQEVIASFAVNGSQKELIRFQLQPYTDAENISFRPLIRGLCYIHPSDDGGSGDGKYSRELQIAINDTFNISQDRVMLATLPVLKAKKYTTEDNPTIRFAPEHVMELENVDDVKEMIIKDDVIGALNQIGILTNKMQTVTALTSGAQGLRGAPSTSATEVATTSNRTDTRTNYKSMTYENTVLVEFYWMIMQMTWRFAKPETGLKLMGEKVFRFDPTKDFFYKPVTGAIETEESKANKIRQWTQLLQIMVQVQHPQVVNLINDVVTKISVLMGDEKSAVVKKLLDPKVPIQQNGQDQPQAQAGGAASNQNGVPQSIPEQSTRESSNVI